MSKVSLADKAYAAAVKAIEFAQLDDLELLSFRKPRFFRLDRIPPEVRNIKRLKALVFDATSISDLSALKGMTGLQSLSLYQTAVSDLSPLQGMAELQGLALGATAVTDLSPLRGMARLEALYLNDTAIADLSPLQGMTELKGLNLNQTSVSDLTPLQGMMELQWLYLNQTSVTDLSPLHGMTGLQSLSTDQTGIADLRVLLRCPKLGNDADGGLSFSNTAATSLDPELRRLSEIEDNAERTRDTIAYLKTLPPWPEPLPSQVQAADDLPITVETILTAQTPLGWRFSPTHGAMVVYVQEQPLTAFQSQLADMTKDRTRDLLAKLAGANHGLRQDAREEAQRFSSILSDDTRPLSLRSLELWGSLVALGSQLDAHDMGRAQGRDALDMLATDQRAALMTLLQIAGNLVRSFPDVKAMDEGAGGFLRREVTLDMVAAMIEAALRAAYVAPNSAALMQHVAGIGKSEGGQAEKATSVSVRGILNLITSATLIAGRATGIVAVTAALGAAAGIGEHVGSIFADHYELDQAAVTFIEKVRAQLDSFSDNLPPDEAAQLRAAVRDMEERLADPKSGPQ